MTTPNTPKTTALIELIETVHRLRAPDGCPWDREQTHQSLRPFLIEEAYEVLAVLDMVEKDDQVKTDPRIQAELKEELGDLLLQVLLHSEMASEKSAFSIEDVARFLNEKLIRRHPHVFRSEIQANSADEAYRNWERLKAEEKKAKKDPARASVLDGLPPGLPQLQRAARVIEKVTKVGFQWPDLEGPMEKVKEEVAELEELVRRQQSGESIDRQKLEHELGDALFTLCNLSAVLKLNPEDALRTMLSRFERRFRHVETRLREQGRTPEQSTLEEMDRYWDEAKALELKEK